VELIDIAPTLIDAANQEIPYYMQGKSLEPILSGEQDPSFHKPHVISEYHGAMGGDRMPDQTHGVMYYDGRYKISVYQGHNIGELYDLKADPGEFDNLWDKPENMELKAAMVRKAFDAYLLTSDAGIRRTERY
jgi:arylsulfatase A-like enzyme